MTWQSIPFGAATGFRVPRKPGVYAILRVRRLRGLPAAWEVFYVGKSLDLHRRFREHALPRRERNVSLRRQLSQREARLEFWFAAVPNADLDEIERELIRGLTPKGNKVMYGGVQ